MNNEDKQEFVRVLNGLAAIKRVDLTKEAYEMWWLSMNDWDIADFRGAASHLLKSCEFMPAPHDFEQLKKAQKPNAREAWADALAFADGRWRTEIHPDPTVNDVVHSLGGWSAIALCNLEKLGFLERRFLDTYSERIESDGARKALPNFNEKAQLRNGKVTAIEDIAKKITG